MSWDADLYDDRGHHEGWWNYTHNCNPMANAVLDPSYEDTWFRHLDGMSGAEGAGLLNQIITRLEADPERFRAMNPPNGWGDYDGFLGVLREMRKASLVEWPTVWRVTG